MHTTPTDASLEALSKRFEERFGDASDRYRLIRYTGPGPRQPAVVDSARTEQRRVVTGFALAASILIVVAGVVSFTNQPTGPAANRGNLRLSVIDRPVPPQGVPSISLTLPRRPVTTQTDFALGFRLPTRPRSNAAGGTTNS